MKDKEKQRLYMIQYRAANAERLRILRKEKYEANRDAISKKGKQDRIKRSSDPSKVEADRKKNRDYYLAHQEELRAYRKQWREKSKTADYSYRDRSRRNLEWLLMHVSHEGEECLIWPFKRHPSGYAGEVSNAGARTLAYRKMCELAYGPAPTSKHEAAHSCGKGYDGCVHPKHLRWATHTENEADKELHGTRLHGEAISQAKLTEKDVSEIRALKGKMTQRELAQKYGVSQGSICRAQRGICWNRSKPS